MACQRNRFYEIIAGRNGAENHVWFYLMGLRFVDHIVYSMAGGVKGLPWGSVVGRPKAFQKLVL